MIESVIFSKAMPQQLKKDSDFVVYTVLTLSRNIDGYDLPRMLNDKQKKEVNLKIKEFLGLLQDYDNLVDSTIVTNRDNELLGLIDRELLDYDFIKFLSEKNKMVKLFVERTLRFVITTNTYDHFNVRSVFIGNGFDDSFDIIERFSILFDDYFVPSFSKSYGYITSDISTIGHGVKVKFLLNIWGLRNSSNLENVLDVLSSNGVLYNYNSLYDRTNFMEFVYVFQPDKSMVANKILFKSLLDRVRDVELEERRKLKSRYGGMDLLREYNDFKNTISSANFIHYKAFLGLMSKLSMISFFGNINDDDPVDLSEIINFLIVLLRDASIMLYSNIIPNESLIGRERSVILKKFFNFGVNSGASSGGKRGR
ncbi:MAG: hypothetical protein ACK4F9_05255 [Brevinematia bacterium]